MNFLSRATDECVRTIQETLRDLKSTSYVSGGYPETMALAKPICDDLIDDLIQLGETATFSEKIKVFNICQRRLNSLMMTDGVDADTVERDIFYQVLENIGAIVQMDSTEENKNEFIDKVLDSEELVGE